MIARYEFLRQTDHADLRSALHFIAGYAPEVFAAAMEHIELLQYAGQAARETIEAGQ